MRPLAATRPIDSLKETLEKSPGAPLFVTGSPHIRIAVETCCYEVPIVGLRRVRAGNRVKSRRNWVYILRSCLLLGCSIYGATEGLYGQYTTLQRFFTRGNPSGDWYTRSSCLLYVRYSDPPSAIPSHRSRPCVRILIHRMRTIYVRSSI